MIPTRKKPTMPNKNPQYVYGTPNKNWKGPIKAIQESTITSLDPPRDIDTSARITPIPLTPAATDIVNILSDNGLQPLLVGGTVRDHLLGISSKDIDIEIHGAKSLHHITGILHRNGIPYSEVGQAFGIIKSTHLKEDIDLSLPRIDSLANSDNTHRSIHAEVDPTLSIEDASKRRDYTINAIMYDPTTQEYLDPHNGIEALQEGILAAVDDDTFIEDPLRALRGVQFAARFDMDMDDHTVELCRAMTSEGLAKERIAEELHKLVLKGQNIHQGINILHEIEWNSITPTLNNNLDNPLSQRHITAIQQDSRLDRTARMAFITSLIDHHYGSKDGQLSHDLMLTGTERKLFNKISLSTADTQLSNSRMRRHLYSRGYPQEYAEILPQALGVDTPSPLWSGSPPPYTVSGDVLIGKGLKPGPDFARIISHYADVEDTGGKVNLDNLNLNP